MLRMLLPINDLLWLIFGLLLSLSGGDRFIVCEMLLNNLVFSLRILLSFYYKTLLTLSMNHLIFSNIIFVTHTVNIFLRKPQSGEKTVMGKSKVSTSLLLVPFICPKLIPYTKISYVMFLLVLLITHTIFINLT